MPCRDDTDTPHCIVTPMSRRCAQERGARRAPGGSDRSCRLVARRLATRAGPPGRARRLPTARLELPRRVTCAGGSIALGAPGSETHGPKGLGCVRT